MEKLDQTISWYEINKSTTQLANDKAPGLNGVPNNAFKSLDDANLSWLLLFYNQFWHSQSDFDKWNEGQVVPVPNKCDTINPNKCIGIALMDTGNNIYSSIMCGWLFKIISKHGVKCQFLSTPGFGCQDGTFTNQYTSTSKKQPQPSNMGGICRPSQGLQHLQSRTTHRHTRKIWCTPNTMLSNQTHIQKNHSQAHHWQGGNIH